MAIASMTGFGSSLVENEVLIINTEIKSLNSKFLDINVRLPRSFPNEKELEIRNLLKEYLERGKIFASIDIQSKLSADTAVKINKEIVKTYIQTLQQIALESNIKDDDTLRLALQMPDATSQSLNNEDSLFNVHWETIKKSLLDALNKCVNFRLTEGKALAKVLLEQGKNIEQYLKEVEPLDKKRIPAIKQKIEQRLTELLQTDTFDRNRLEQEMIFYVEKLDISEEKDRLQQHLNLYFEKLNGEEANGRVINFISQEMGREINTIGSKANDASLQHLVVKMKEELEKIKEQSLNIL
jgi:uncharacterized protein (TIGR00255 family)